MSFFFNPFTSQFQNCCYFVSSLPYIVQFQQSSSFDLSGKASQFQIKKQQTTDISIKGIESTMELQKFNYFPEEQHQQIFQNQIYLSTNKYGAAISLGQFQKNERSCDKNSYVNEKSSVLGKFNEKSFNKISKTQKIKKNKQRIQEEYQPFEKRKKCESNFKENQNRNIIPNQVNQIFSYIQKSSKSKYVVSRIFSKYPPINPQYNMKKFYLYQSILKQKVSNYINESSLCLVTELYEPRCEVYSQQQQRYYNKICRILIHHFLQQDSIFNILTSRRMHKDKKRGHLEMRRVLKEKVVEILRH